MKELQQLFISALGAAITAGLITLFQYLGAHIGDALSLGAMWGGARAALLLPSHYA